MTHPHTQPGPGMAKPTHLGVIHQSNPHPPPAGGTAHGLVEKNQRVAINKKTLQKGDLAAKKERAM